MSINAWYPKLRADGVIASGNVEIWITPLSGPSFRKSAMGGNPIWAGQTLVYNRNDGTTQVGPVVVSAAYNEYAGSNIGQWAGGTLGAGRVDRYDGATLLEQIPGGCVPGFAGGLFGYLTPLQTAPDLLRTLVVGGIVRTQPAIIETWVPDKSSREYVYVVVAPGKKKHIVDRLNRDITIRKQQDETPIVLFTGPEEYGTMMLSGIGGFVFARGIYAATGWLLPVTDEFYNSDARMVGDLLWAVGSTHDGQPQFLRFALDPAKRMDVRDL